MGRFRKQKKNEKSHPNIGSLKTASWKGCNKISEEFIFLRCKSFWGHVDSIIKKWWPYCVNLLLCIYLLILLFIFLN